MRLTWPSNQSMVLWLYLGSQAVTNNTLMLAITSSCEGPQCANYLLLTPGCQRKPLTPNSQRQASRVPDRSDSSSDTSSMPPQVPAYPDPFSVDRFTALAHIWLPAGWCYLNRTKSKVLYTPRAEPAGHCKGHQYIRIYPHNPRKYAINLLGNGGCHPFPLTGSRISIEGSHFALRWRSVRRDDTLT